MTRRECIDRYGAIDFSTKYWPDKSKWIKLLEIPDNWFFGWYVLNTHLPVRHIACNTDIHKPLLNALEQVSRIDPGGLHTFDGCFNIRLVRGSSINFSAHSYGLAIDLNAKENLLGATSGGFYNTPNIVKAFQDQGFVWGGNFGSRKDPMHFSWCGF